MALSVYRAQIKQQAWSSAVLETGDRIGNQPDDVLHKIGNDLQQNCSQIGRGSTAEAVPPRAISFVRL